MPVLGYFAVVGILLTAGLFVADATMTRPARMSVTSNFDGLPAEYKGAPNTRRPERAPAIASIEPVAETTGSAPAKEEHVATPAPAPARPAVKPAKPQHKVVVHRRQRQDDDPNWFGGDSRRDFAFGPRGDSFGWSREPSWRDSWAAGGFDQPRERFSRRAFPQNNDNWSFR
jgi:hypothetical protein